MNELLFYFIGTSLGIGIGWSAHILHLRRRASDTKPARPPEPPTRLEAVVSATPAPFAPAPINAAPTPAPLISPSGPFLIGPTAIPQTSPRPAPTLSGTSSSDDDIVLDIGQRASLPELITRAPVELGLSRRDGVWTLQVFALSGIATHLGDVPIESASLPITAAAHELHFAQGDNRDTLDLSAYVNTWNPQGRAALADEVKPSFPGLFAFARDGVVTIVSITAPTGSSHHLADRSGRVDAIVSSYHQVWLGDADAHAAALRQDVMRALDYWPEMPSGGAVAVAVAGPGVAGATWGAAGDAFTFSRQKNLLVVQHPVHDAVRVLIDNAVQARG